MTQKKESVDNLWIRNITQKLGTRFLSLCDLKICFVR